jgi:parallel beta-helix repeat protein
MSMLRGLINQQNSKTMRHFISLLSLALCAALLSQSRTRAADYYVSPTGKDAGDGTKASPWRSIQHAASALKPGDTAHVQAGTYAEKVEIKSQGSQDGGFVTLQAEGPVIVSGAGIQGENIFRIKDRNYVRISGFEIRDNLKVKDGSGIRVEGACDHIELIKNRIHEIRGKDAMGITIYGKNNETPLSNLLIEGNEIFDCEPAQSETLTLNGNVSGFKILNNILRDVNNIGICMIGGEKWINKDRSKVTRNGLVKGNKVSKARSNYGDGYAAGIYVDGGSDIVIEDNEVTGCNLGIEVGAENKGTVTSGVIVRNNRVFLNQKAGIVFGGYDQKAGRVTECVIENNICYHNDQHKDKNGELWIQIATNCTINGNVFWGGADGPILQAVEDAVGHKLNNNIYYSESGIREAEFHWRGNDLNGFAAYLRASGQDAGSRFEQPAFRAPEKGDFSKP